MPANSTGEGKGLETITIVELLHLLFPEGVNAEFDATDVPAMLDVYTHQIEQHCELKFKAADSALRLKLADLIAAKRSQAEHIARVCMAESNQFRAGDMIAFCDELSTLLTEEST